MFMIKRAVITVLDSVGAGALPDADRFGDKDSDTLGNLAKTLGGLNLPNMAKLGLGNLHQIFGIEKAESPLAFYGRMAEISQAKDTVIGHWELTGVISTQPFPTYPHGFPPELIEEFEQKIGRKILGNKPASGTEIIKELGEQHCTTGSPIVYTSADSVFQIAAHEEIIPLDELYRICRVAREMLVVPHNLARVIARPFKGDKSSYVRTPKRKDFSLPSPELTLLDLAQKAGLTVYGVGKISDIFAGRGITQTFKTENNAQGIAATLSLLQQEVKPGIIMTNLVDFDMLYGHRNDPVGYYNALKEFDLSIPQFISALNREDVWFITADHGCDPTILTSTDHTREYVPLLVYGQGLAVPKALGNRESFADMGKTIQELLGLPGSLAGKSFARILLG